MSQKIDLGYKWAKIKKIFLLPGDGIGPEVVGKLKK